MNEDKQQQDWKEKNKEEQESVLKKSHKWESPEIDKISNFWIHALISEYRISSNKRTMWIAKGAAHTWVLALIKPNAVLATITANIAHK